MSSYFCSWWSELVEVDVSFIDSFDELCEAALGDFVTELEDWFKCCRLGESEFFFSFLFGSEFCASSICSGCGRRVPVPLCFAN